MAIFRSFASSPGATVEVYHRKGVLGDTGSSDHQRPPASDLANIVTVAPNGDLEVGGSGPYWLAGPYHLIAITLP